MLHKATFLPVIALGLLASVAAFAAGSDPTVQQIYQAAQAGNLAQAEQMVNQVLEDHPRSGKAHYVAAEVYARAGDFSTARRELAQAQALEPGLPFARPQSVRALETELAQGRFVQRAQRVPYAPYAAPSGLHSRSPRPWSLILLLVAGVIIIWALVRRRRQTLYTGYPGQPGMPPQAGVGPMGMGGPPSYPYGYGPGPGSGIMSGIGTGLAVGAGMAAGEALVNRVIEGPQSGGIIPPAEAGGLTEPPPANGDMGGDDFGVSDPGSWDGGGGDPGGGGDFGAGGDGGWT